MYQEAVARGKAVSNRSSNKYGTLISFAPAVAVGRGAFLLCFLPANLSPRPRLSRPFTTHPSPQQTLRLLVPVTRWNLGSSKLGDQLT